MKGLVCDEVLEMCEVTNACIVDSRVGYRMHTGVAVGVKDTIQRVKRKP